MKRCHTCKELKEVQQFYKNRSTDDGLQHACKDCLIEWQRSHIEKINNKRRYDGLREIVISRDASRCVGCGMTRDEHRLKWNKDITIDHIDGKGINTRKKNNNINNLQTLCLKCHGSKDGKRHGKEK